MNDDHQTPIAPEPQTPPQPVQPPIAPPASPAPPSAPRITDITRVSRPASNPVTAQSPIAPPASPAPLAQPTPQSTPQPILQPMPQPAPTVPTALPVATTTEQASQYEDEAEQSASIADTMKTIFWGIINWAVAPLLIVFILHNFVFQAYHVDGSSMTPTLHTADYMIVSKVENTLAKLTGKSYIPRRHQVVVFNYPQDPSLIFIKRVTALPGERVVVKNGTITIYNSEHPEGFSPDDGTFERSATYTEGDVDEVVPEGSIFVVGDNRLPSGSYDSREWGMLPSKDIIGNAVIRLLPLDGFRFFNRIPEVTLGLN